MIYIPILKGVITVLVFMYAPRLIVEKKDDDIDATMASIITGTALVWIWFM